MRGLLRVLAPLLGLALAGAGAVLAVEVVVAWVRPATGTGLLVPWPGWRATTAALGWADPPVPAAAVGAAVVGLVLLLVALLARRHDVVLTPPSPDLTVTTSPRVLAALVGRRVRAVPGVASATVTASRRRVGVAAQTWNDAGPDLGAEVTIAVAALLDALPLAREPRVTVTLQEREGPR